MSFELSEFSSGSSGFSSGAAESLSFSVGSSGSSGSSWGSSSGSSWSGAASSGVSLGGAAAAFVSAVEQAVLSSQQPVASSESQEITVNGQRGLWLNRAEVAGWSGPVPLSSYAINEDSNPEVVVKSAGAALEYVQELAVRYLRPPTPPAPGDILIVQQGNDAAPPAPPLVIRQQPARPETPAPLVIREAPPAAPSSASLGRKVITISGRRLPPPPRKVVIERLAPLPAKPQSVLIERWLPYTQQRRRVIFQRAGGDAVAVRPRNVVVQWEAPQVNVRREIKNLGVVRANPAEYVQRYGSSLRSARDLPSFVLEIRAPSGVVLAADAASQSAYELEGDVQALALVDLDREGLSEYRSQLQRLGVSASSGASSSSASWGSSSSSGSSFSSGGGLEVSFSSSASF